MIVAVNEQQQSSRKRIRNDSAWKRIIKKARLHGQEYVNSKGDIIGTVTPNFDVLCGTKKCRLRCSTKLEKDERAKIVSEFYKLNAEGQNSHLFGCMQFSQPKSAILNAQRHRDIAVKYTVLINSSVAQVSKKHS